jgi:hypothetical protein
MRNRFVAVTRTAAAVAALVWLVSAPVAGQSARPGSAEASARKPANYGLRNILSAARAEDAAAKK